MIKSIHDLVPLDLSGRPARRGFEYQDHVGAGYCLEMILNSAIKQIWFETEDDLTIIWDKSNKTIVEFVQVKNVNLQSRWSPSTICNKGEKGSSKCIVETSLAQDRCEEDTLFRIVSSYDVNDDLAVLKNPLGEKFRQDEIEKEDALIKSIKKKLGEVVSPKGNGIDYWVKNCLWEKLADTPQALEALNIQEKLSLCLKAMGLSLFQDQIKELYQRLLGYIVKASNSDIKLNPEISKVTREGVMSWLRSQVDSFNAAKMGTDRLVDKMKSAGFDDIIIGIASDLKWQYKMARLDVDYIRSNKLEQLEQDLTDILSTELFKYDAGKLSMTPSEFLEHCSDIISSKMIHTYSSVPVIIGKGYMFERTNRCLHRFKEASV